MDNTHNSEDTIPLSRVDWFHYGGITRPVEVMELGEVWIKNARIDYELSEGLDSADIKIETTFEGLKEKTLTRNLSIHINENRIYEGVVEIDGEKSISINYTTFEDFELWDTKNPALYTVRLEIEDDDSIEMIGFRKVEAKDK